MDRQISFKELVSIMEAFSDERVVLSVFNVAIMERKLSAVHILSQLVVKSNQRDDNGFTSMHYASQSGYLEIFKYLASNTKEDDKLLTSNEQWTCLHLSSITGNRTLCEFLVEKRAFEVDCRDFLGYTPLHYACEIGNVEVVRYLLSVGADLSITSTDEEQVTPECLARINNHKSVLDVLTSWRDFQKLQEIKVIMHVLQELRKLATSI